MNIYTSGSLQLMLTVLQAANAVSDFEPGPRFGVAIALGIVQVGLHMHAGKHNPDGTSASASYLK